MSATIQELPTSDLIAELRRRTVKLEATKVVDIVLRVAEVTGVPGDVILGKRQAMDVCFARFICIYQARKLNSYWTLEKTARQFGFKAHGTILHALKAYQTQYASNPHFRKYADQCDNLIFT